MMRFGSPVVLAIAASVGLAACRDRRDAPVPAPVAFAADARTTCMVDFANAIAEFRRSRELAQLQAAHANRC